MQPLQNPPLCGSIPSALPENGQKELSNMYINYCESWNANIREDHADMFSFLSDTATMMLHLAFLALSHSSLSVAG
jgi:hypothetical protein